MNATRRQAREWAVQMLTAADLNPPSDVHVFMAGFWEQLYSLDAEDFGPDGKIARSRRAFSEERVIGVLEKMTEIDEVLRDHLAEWDLYRLGTVERSVLRLGAWEILYSDVPKPVAINEAIDISNWFSSPRSRTLVNAVLDSINKPS